MISRLSIFLILSIAFISCKKEAKIDIDDLPNNNFRILKVEQTMPINMPPFWSLGKITALYNYNRDSIQVTLVRQSDQTILSPILIVNRDSLNFEIEHSKNYKYFSLYNWVAGITNSYINIGNNRIRSLTDMVYHNNLLTVLGQSRIVTYIYEDDQLKTIEGISRSGPIPAIQGKAFEVTVSKYINSKALELTDRTYLNLQVLDPYKSPALPLSTLGREYSLNIAYQQDNTGIPKELVRMVNNALLGLSKGPLEDYEIFQWESNFLFQGNVFFKDIETSGNPFLNYEYGSSFADWLWTFAHPSFNVLPEQDQIISSKRMVGKKLVDIVDGEPVYQAVDSTANFPYTHDQVAKTLEIAGLKIWYEVVD